MRKFVSKVLLFLFILVISQQAISQNSHQDTITIIKNGKVFMHQYDVLSMYELEQLIKTNTDAYSVFKGARKNKSASMVLGGFGGAFIGFPLGQMIAGGDPYWWMMGVGGALILVSIPFSDYNKDMRRAVEIYNEAIRTENRIKSELSFGLQSNGIGLVLKF
jgi:hypothetical protein